MSDAQRQPCVRTAKEVVFILDDEPDDLVEYLSSSLGPKGITVQCARNIEKGLALAERLVQDGSCVVAVIDLHLPLDKEDAASKRVDRERLWSALPAEQGLEPRNQSGNTTRRVPGSGSRSLSTTTKQPLRSTG
jgi:hypothetical protein